MCQTNFCTSWAPGAFWCNFFNGYMDPINAPSELKSLKIKFKSSTMILSNVTTFGVAARANLLAVEVVVEFKDRYQLHTWLLWIVAHVHGFRANTILTSNSPIWDRCKSLMYYRFFSDQIHGKIPDLIEKRAPYIRTEGWVRSKQENPLKCQVWALSSCSLEYQWERRLKMRNVRPVASFVLAIFFLGDSWRHRGQIDDRKKCCYGLDPIFRKKNVDVWT